MRGVLFCSSFDTDLYTIRAHECMDSESTQRAHGENNGPVTHGICIYKYIYRSIYIYTYTDTYIYVYIYIYIYRGMSMHRYEYI